MPLTRIADLEIRPCRPTECAAVLELWHAHHPPSIDDLADVMRLVEEFDGHLLVATSRGEIVGALIAGWDGWRGHLHHLAVRPDTRRQGVGSALIQAAQRLLITKGAKRISVLVERDNSDAMKFYESLQTMGYALDTRMQRYVRAARPDNTPP